ncbi:hypothetical protein HYPSUDRAFT_542998 [Hypholoma sublateritium FD-334 SS-4]|uniref:Uncharacterized protein n=1 Tax=Hypholoma sublateritium (strain FD-334 SS-4) TaxID=945553 RepID=A0A0D2KGF7_HYPSF|nr:hypothetical protein HYPSUDRAFT_542998 [Hypholoma sublateritium FD-334 SS-4]
MAVSSRVMPMITVTIVSARELKFRCTLSHIEASFTKGKIRALVSLNKASGGKRYVYIKSAAVV